MGAIAERVWAEVDLDAIAHNLQFAQVRVGQSVGVMGVVKSNAYGHGAVEVAREVERRGARAVGVATPAEAIELREAGIAIPIVVIGSCLEHEIEPALEFNVSLSVSPVEMLRPIEEAARRLGRRASVHLLVDTGMSRDGVPADQAVSVADEIEDSPHLHQEGTYTHLATASLPDKGFCLEQLDRFNGVIRDLYARDIHPGLIHCANSSAAFTLPGSHFDMIRQGITLYGLAPSEHVEPEVELSPAMTVKTRVMAVRELKPGESVGYFRQFVADRPTRVATIPMGYADGLRLGLSGHGHVLIKGRPAPIVGRVMMDCTVVDITHLPGTPLGTEVTVLGKSGRHRIDAADLARPVESSPYEVLCSFGHRVRRIYTRSGKRAINRAAAEPEAVVPEPFRVIPPDSAPGR